MANKKLNKWLKKMKSEAQEEITKLEEESRLNYEMPVMDMMG